MPETISAAPADEPGRHKGCRKNAAKLRDGGMKRGRTWSYVIRVKDPETGVGKPRWVGGFTTEEAAKAARDEARVSARQGRYRPQLDHRRRVPRPVDRSPFSTGQAQDL